MTVRKLMDPLAQDTMTLICISQLLFPFLLGAENYVSRFLVLLNLSDGIASRFGGAPNQLLHRQIQFDANMEKSTSC